MKKEKSFLVFKEDEYLNMANFIIGTTKSFEDIKTKEKIGFGILPYRKDENILDSEKEINFYWSLCTIFNECYFIYERRMKFI